MPAQEIWNTLIARPSQAANNRRRNKPLLVLPDRELTSDDRAAFARSAGNMDAAMWYGAMCSSGSKNNRVGEMIRRCFQTLYYGGLIVRYGEYDWQSWSDTRWPIAMAPSHGGRIIVQLPKVSRQFDPAEFWNWLWADCWQESRFTATHGVNRDFREHFIGFGRWKRMEEVKGWFLGFQRKADWGHHFGVEIALGGAGQLNPFSGRRISPDGSNGHLYLHYVKATSEKYGAILLGCETSSPLDRLISYNNPSPPLRFAGLPFPFALFDGWISSSDNYGGGHGAGGSNTFSATGGLKFDGKMKVKGSRGKEARNIHWQRVVGGCLGSMIVDLVDPLMIERVMNTRFNPNDLTEPGPPPISAQEYVRQVASRFPPGVELPLKYAGVTEPGSIRHVGLTPEPDG